LQNVAAGFSLRWHRLESLCHRVLIEQPGKIFSPSMNFARGSVACINKRINCYNSISITISS